MLSTRKSRIEMYTTLTLIFAFLLLLFTYLKDREQKLEDDEKENIITGKTDSLAIAQKELIKLQEENRRDSKTLIDKQENIDLAQKDLINKYSELTTKQENANSLQKKLNEYVTGGDNKPVIIVKSLPIQLKPGHENIDRVIQQKYKPMHFYVVNKGSIPLRGLQVRIAGSLGFEMGVDVQRAEGRKMLSFKETAPMTIPAGKDVLFYTGNYELWNSKLSFAIDVTWENGFYTMYTTYECRPPFEPFRKTSEKYKVGNVNIENPAEFLSKQ